MIREHFRNTENRKAELDPSTFANDADLIAWVEELQTQPERTGLNWHVLIGWPVMIAVGVAAWWLLFTLIF